MKEVDLLTGYDFSAQGGQTGLRGFTYCGHSNTGQSPDDLIEYRSPSERPVLTIGAVTRPTKGKDDE